MRFDCQRQSGFHQIGNCDQRIHLNNCNNNWFDQSLFLPLRMFPHFHIYLANKRCFHSFARKSPDRKRTFDYIHLSRFWLLSIFHYLNNRWSYYKKAHTRSFSQNNRLSKYNIHCCYSKLKKCLMDRLSKHRDLKDMFHFVYHLRHKLY